MKETSKDTKALRMLRSAKLYRTASREAILNVLAEADRPLSQDEIAGRPGAERLNKVTIYRTLESFLEAGLVHEVFLRERAWHFELADHCTESQCHPHFTCISCGTTHCLTGMPIPMTASPYRGFVIYRQQVRLEGLCPACA